MTNSTDSGPQDAVELARKVLALENWKREPGDTLLPVSMWMNYASMRAALPILAQAVLDSCTALWRIKGYPDNPPNIAAKCRKAFAVDALAVLSAIKEKE